MGFQIGDIVRCVGDDSGNTKYLGLMGTIIMTNRTGSTPLGPHPYEMSAALGVGFSERELRLVESPKQNYWFIQDPKMFDKMNYSFDALSYGPGEVIKTKKSIMSKVTTMFKKLLDPDTQALVEAGYLDQNLEITNDGEFQLKVLAFELNRAALVTLAKEKIAEAKAAK